MNGIVGKSFENGLHKRQTGIEVKMSEWSLLSNIKSLRNMLHNLHIRFEVRVLGIE